MSLGFFVAVDGPSGVGKSTTTRLLCDQLTAAGHDVVATREPTAEALGELARHGTDTYRGPALACLVAADRYHHGETCIRPALAAGKVVVCDRYLPSSLVLQTLDGVDRDFVWAINRDVERPDLTILLTGDPQQSRDRAKARGTYSRFHRGGTLSGADETAKYSMVGQELAAAGHPVFTYTVGHADPDAVTQAVLAEILRRLPATPT